MGSSAVTPEFGCVCGRQTARGYEGRATLPAAFPWHRRAEKCVDSAQRSKCHVVTGGLEAIWAPDSSRGKRGISGSGVG